MSAENLSAELWLEIFGHLDYFTLNATIPRTCKFFQSLVARRSSKSKTLRDLTLFRDHPMKRNPDTVYTLHPFLSVNSNSHTADGKSCRALNRNRNEPREVIIFTQNILFSFSTVIDDLRRFLSTKGRKWNVWHENATSPATQNVRLRCASGMNNEDAILEEELRIASKSSAITVFDVTVAKLVALYRYERRSLDTPAFRRECPPSVYRSEIILATRWALAKRLGYLDEDRNNPLSEFSVAFGYIMGWIKNKQADRKLTAVR